METEKTAVQLIQDYFAGLKYPAIKEIKPCLMNEHGDVYLVSFEKKVTESGTGAIRAVPPPDCQYPLIEGPAPDDWKREPVTVEVAIPNCYAIVTGSSIDGFKVAGYNEDFWSDADKYRLALKQHLGYLAMEAKQEFNTPIVPDEEMEKMKSKPVQESRDGYSKNATVDAIVERYEEMLVKAQMETDQTAHEAMTREAELTKQLIDTQTELVAAKAKLETIQQVLTGKSDGTMETQPPSPVACMLDQDNIDPYTSADEAVDSATVLRADTAGKRDVPQGMYSRIPDYIMYHDHNAAWPKQDVMLNNGRNKSAQAINS